MTAPSQPLFTFLQKSNVQIHNDIIRTLKNGLVGLGVANPNVGPNSDYDLLATAVGNEIAVVHANTVIQSDANMPDTAGGPNLDRWLAIENLQREGAVGSIGNISAPCSVTTPVAVPALAQLTDASGLRFQVSIGGLYTAVNGYLTIPIAGVDTGSATNHNNGDPLQWVTAPPFCATNVTVGAVGGSDGLAGGSDSEATTDEPPRARLLTALKTPAKGGNAADIQTWGNASTPAVQMTWVYPALLGPGTVFFLCAQRQQNVAPFSSGSMNRSLPITTMSGTVVPYVQGLIPGYAFSCGASVTNTPADIAVLLSLPSAPTASPPGLGGGWLDGTPWPSTIGGATPPTITSVTSSTVFTLNATTPPTAGVNNVAWISPLNWQLYTAQVLAVSGSSGSYTVTISNPFVGIASGNYVFPQSTNQLTYFAAVLGAFGTMGPGEWTAVAAVLARSFRHPPAAQIWPNALNAVFLKQIISSGSEVLDANWIYRSPGGNPPTPPGAPTVDANGNLTSTAPGLYVPRNIGFYAA